MKIVAGLSLKNLQPRVWDVTSKYFLRDLEAVMVSFADFSEMPVQRLSAMDLGLRNYLNTPADVDVYLDNGAFAFASRGGEPSADGYRRFVARAQPDWRPVRFDAIPSPRMERARQRKCFEQTMRINVAYQHDGYVPVVHVGLHLADYIKKVKANRKLRAKECIALGGLVPNLLRTPKAAAYSDILDDLIKMRREFPNKKIHVFGIGGTATIHVAALLGFDSVDSSGWRNRAARGIIQLPGSGERMVANLGSWRGRELSKDEKSRLERCACPACSRFHLRGLRESGIAGFSNRATHNLWVLLQEAKWVNERLANGNYERYFRRRLDNTIYLPLIEQILQRQRQSEN